jgi:hypothetical protein
MFLITFASSYPHTTTACPPTTFSPAPGNGIAPVAAACAIEL